MNNLIRIRLVVLLLFASASLAGDAQVDVVERIDILVYGGTPAGIAAAIGAASEGNSVVLAEPTHRIGGMVTSGLSHSDFRTREGLTGAFLDFAQRVERHYIQTYGANSDQVRDCFGGTFAEPKVSLLVLEQMLHERPNIAVRVHHQLVHVDVANSTTKKSSAHRTIQRVILRDKDGSARSLAPRVVIDATYEGDLMARAGVSWRAGREAESEFRESLAPRSADDQLQAYNFRFTMTKERANQVAPAAPAGYRREDFLHVLQALAAPQTKSVFGYPTGCIFKAQTPILPNGKYDINDVSRGLVRLSLPGKNLGWPNGTAEDREQIFAEHLRDQVGLLYFLQNDESVPLAIRNEARAWGWCRDEFVETNHLPPQLYVREARRMMGLYVYSQRDSDHSPGDARSILHPDAIAAGDYGNNCHGTAHIGPRFGGEHTGEFYRAVPPYQIPYGVLVSREVTNLLVPAAVSSTHVGFCAIRLEPIWMSLGQAAGYAAEQALRNNLTVQNVAVAKLQSRLHRAGQATIYVSDVKRSDPQFAAVQWWGNLGGLHGLAPMPETPGKRGRNIHGQYYEAAPGQEAQLATPLDEKTARRWTVLATLVGVPFDQVPKSVAGMTRGDFIQGLHPVAIRTGLTESTQPITRLHPKAIPNHHPPGEVDNVELAQSVVWQAGSLPGIVVDECDAELVGDWQYSTHTPPYVGRGYLHDLKDGKGQKSITFTPTLPRAGVYEVRVSHCYNVRRATNTLITVKHLTGESSVRIDQQQTPEHNGLFRTIGRYQFDAGQTGWVRISNDGTDGKYVIADAVQFLPVDSASGLLQTR